MSISTAYHNSRHVVGPLILLWLLCQSMLVCAGLLGHHGLAPTSSAGILTSHSMSHIGMDDHSRMTSADVQMQDSEVARFAPLHQNQHEASKNECCGEQDNFLPNFPLSLVIPLFFAIALLGLIQRTRSKSKCSRYFEDPPPDFNYPRNHLVNCTFID